MIFSCLSELFSLCAWNPPSFRADPPVARNFSALCNPTIFGHHSIGSSDRSLHARYEGRRRHSCGFHSNAYDPNCQLVGSIINYCPIHAILRCPRACARCSDLRSGENLYGYSAIREKVRLSVFVYTLSACPESWQREKSIALSPVFGHFETSIHGLTSIRAYGAEDAFKEKSMALIDHYSRPSRVFYNLNRCVLSFAGIA